MLNHFEAEHQVPCACQPTLCYALCQYQQYYLRPEMRVSATSDAINSALLDFKKFFYYLKLVIHEIENMLKRTHKQPLGLLYHRDIACRGAGVHDFHVQSVLFSLFQPICFAFLDLYVLC